MNSNTLILTARSQTQKTENLLIRHSRKGKMIGMKKKHWLPGFAGEGKGWTARVMKNVLVRLNYNVLIVMIVPFLYCLSKLAELYTNKSEDFLYLNYSLIQTLGKIALFLLLLSPWAVTSVASWPTYMFIRRQVRYLALPSL